MATPPASSGRTPASSPVSYRIDADDCLVYFAPGWAEAAQAGGGGVGGAETYLGRKLWDCMRDPAVKDLYSRLVRRARQGRATRFLYRCDSPTHRRIFRMQIQARPGGVVEFLSVPEAEATHAVVPGDRPAPPARRSLRMCRVRLCSARLARRSTPSFGVAIGARPWTPPHAGPP